MDLSCHQGGILKLACRAVFTPFESDLRMEIIECQGEKQKKEQEGEIAIFSQLNGHRIPSGINIKEIERKCQILSMTQFLCLQNFAWDRDESVKAGF